MAEQISRLESHDVRVEGHTDSVPIKTEQFPSNWELSAARASGVVRFLIQNGVDSSRLSATGYGAERPLVANDSAKNRARNRRIEILLVPRDAE